ncbi:MAG: hypothetical protein V3R57_06645 [Candidatus Bathyarchaeia archaeon]
MRDQDYRLQGQRGGDSELAGPLPRARRSPVLPLLAGAQRERQGDV